MDVIAGKVFLMSGLLLLMVFAFITKCPETWLSDQAVMEIMVAFFASIAVFVVSGVVFIWL